MAEPRDRWGRPMGPCENPLCDRYVPQGIQYCCAGCAAAHVGKYEIHEDGPLGHTGGCNEKYAQRGPYPPRAIRKQKEEADAE